jgi:hypothetical protein
VSPESLQFVARRVGLVYGAASTGRLQATATRACHRRLVQQGIDLGSYDTTEDAADFADLRVALGIAEWNLCKPVTSFALGWTGCRRADEKPVAPRSIGL